MNGEQSKGAGNDTVGYWFKCKGCGGMIGFFPKGLPPYYPPGACAHSKPANKLGIADSVPCDLYRRCSAQQLKEIHADAEPIEEAPTSMKPFLG